MKAAVCYEFEGLSIQKLTESTESLGSHSSIEIPEEYPFHSETGMFAVEGQEGVFFIKDGKVRDGVHIKSGLKSNPTFYRLIHHEVFSRLETKINSYRTAAGIGPIYDLAGLEVQKVAAEIPYVGHLHTHPVTEQLINEHEWIYESIFGEQKVPGVYRILNTCDIFFIRCNELSVRGEEVNHRLMVALRTQFPVPKDFYADEDLGPCGGAFASEADFWRYKDPTLFR
jgi:hypothetical protein